MFNLVSPEVATACAALGGTYAAGVGSCFYITAAKYGWNDCWTACASLVGAYTGVRSRLANFQDDTSFNLAIAEINTRTTNGAEGPWIGMNA